MDVNYINPFLNGTLEVLKKMAFVDAFAGKPYSKADSTGCGDVSGIIGITGNAVGSLAISFTEESICGITSNMLGETYKDICRDVFDTVGEITNMVSGVARTYMEREGLIVYAAIPTVVYGKNHVIMHILKSPSIVIPFSTKFGQFFVDVCIKMVESDELSPDAATGPVNKVYRPDTSMAGRMRPQPQPESAVPRAAPAAPPAEPEPPAPARTTPLTPEEKIVRSKDSLAKVLAQRDETKRLLKENPFMELRQRQNLNKLLPALEDKIKRLKLDIQAVESLMKMTSDDLDNPKIGKHYQNYNR